MDKKEFKYKTTFASILRSLPDNEKDAFLATASLENLKPFLPQDVDLDVNIDLVPFTMNSFVVNHGNRNGDMVDTKTAIGFYKNFMYKRVDAEHNFKNAIGVHTTVGFSKFDANYAIGGGSIPLTLEQIKDEKNPFNVVVGGFLWRLGNEEIIDLVEQSNDPENENYLTISGSFELGFNEYDICLGTSRYLKDCEI